MTIENQEELEHRIAAVSRIELFKHRRLSMETIESSGEKLWEYKVEAKIYQMLKDSSNELYAHFYENRESYRDRWLEQLANNIDQDIAK